MNTTINISVSTREVLKRSGHKGETYDEIISRLVEIAEMYDLVEHHKWILKNEKFTPVEDL